MNETAKKITKKETGPGKGKETNKSKITESKKFLAVFDGYRFSQSTLDYAIQLTKEADALLVGIFPDESIYRSYNVALTISAQQDADQKLIEIDEKDQEKREETVIKFQKACNQAEIHYTYHKNSNIAIGELKQESIFADMIIINSKESFNPFNEKAPTHFIRELLSDVQCPVLVVPDRFKPIDKITLLYDGAPPSVFAIKMFSYILSNLGNLPIEVFTVKEKAQGAHLPNNKLMREFIKQHFPKAKFIVTKGNPEEQIPGHLRNHKGNELVILGAYRRSEISRWFKTSMADILINELDTPLFIAHNK